MDSIAKAWSGYEAARFMSNILKQFLFVQFYTRPMSGHFKTKELISSISFEVWHNLTLQIYQYQLVMLVFTRHVTFLVIGKIIFTFCEFVFLKNTIQTRG